MSNPNYWYRAVAWILLGLEIIFAAAGLPTLVFAAFGALTVWIVVVFIGAYLTREQ